MSTILRIGSASLLVLLTACGEAVVGRSPYANTPPTVDPIPDVTTPEDTPVTVSITMTDEEDVDVLQVTAESSDPTLIDASGIVVGGSGGTRTLTLTPKPDAFGSATITVTVTDDASYVDPVVLTFTFTVTPVNDPPTVAGLADVTIDEDGSTGPNAFTFVDVDDDVATVTVTATSSDTTLLPTVTLTAGAPGSSSWSATPVADGNGTTTLTFTFDDGTDVTTQTIVLTVTPVNDAPTIGPIADLAIDEDVASGPIAFTIDDIDDPPAGLTLSASSSNPTLIPVANVTFGGTGTSRTVDVIGAQDQFGSATITVTVSDGLLTATETFVVTVNPINDPPVIQAVADVTTDEDTSVPTITVTISDVDDPAATLTLGATSSDTTLIAPAGLVLGGAGGSRTLDVSPVANANGVATITLTVTDPAGANDVTTFTVTIDSVNDVPTITPIADRMIAEDGTTGPIAFAVGDVETAPAALVVMASSSNPAVADAGSFVLTNGGTNRTVTINPVPDGFGTTTITVSVSDGTDTTTTTFQLVVTPVNDPPTITQIASPVVIEEDTSTSPLAFVVADVDNPLSELTIVGNSLTPTIVADDAAHVTLAGSSASPNWTVVVTPLPDQNGNADVRIQVSDLASTVPMNFTVQIDPENDPPVIEAIADQTTAEDTPFAYDVMIDDVDTPLNTITVSVTSSNTTLVPNGNLTIPTTGPVPRHLVITPALNQTGTTTITINASDAFGSATPETFVLTVTPVDDPPTITAIANQTIAEDGTTGALAFTVADVDTPLAALTIGRTSTNATLVPLANAVLADLGGGNWTVTVTPTANGFGFSDLTIAVADATSTVTEPFRVTVTSVNDLPTISALGAQTIAEDGSTSALAFTISDVEDSPCTLALSGNSTAAALVDAGDFAFGGSCGARTVVVTPNADANGSATVTVTVTDSNGGTATSSFLLVVTPVNDAPVIAVVANRTTNEDTPIPGFTIGVTDVDSPLAGITLGAGSSDTGVIANAGLVVTGAAPSFSLAITPVAEQSGLVTVTLTADDQNGGVTTRTFTVDVLVVDDPPIISPIGDVTIDEDQVGGTGSIAFTVTDVDTPLGSVTVGEGSSNLVLVPLANVVLGGTNPSRNVVVTPVANGFGASTITISADDGTTVVNVTFVVNVTSLNDLPTIAAIADQTIDEDQAGGTGAITLVIDDVEDGCAGLTLTATSGDVALMPVPSIVFGGTCPNRTVTLTPVANGHGSSLISIIVTDSASGQASEPFTLVVNSVDDVPVAGADSFLGANGTTGNRSLSGSVIANDSDGDGDPLTYSVPSTTTAQGGIVSITAAGTFTYTPPPGYLSNDTFDYEVTDGTTPVTATVTIQVSLPMIWFVDNSATSPGTTAGGDGGTDAHPFATLVEVETRPDPRSGDVVWLYYGDGTSVGYDDGFTMDDDMQLVGIRSMVGSLPPLVGAPAGSAAIKVGDDCTVSDVKITSGDVGVDATGMGGAVTLTNVEISALPTGVTATGNGTLTLSTVTIGGATTIGLDVDGPALAGSGSSVAATAGSGVSIANSAVSATFTNVSLINGTGSAMGTGLSVVDTTGTLTLGSIDVDVTGTATGIDVDNAIVDVGSTGTIRTGGGGTGIRVENGASLSGGISTFACTSTGNNCFIAENSALGLTIDAFDATTTGVATAVYVDTTTGSLTINDSADGVVNATVYRALYLNAVTGLDVKLKSVSASAPTTVAAIELTGNVGGKLLVNGDGTGGRNGSGGTVTTTNATGTVIDNTMTATFRSMNLTATGASAEKNVSIDGAGIVRFEGCVLTATAGTNTAQRCIAVTNSRATLTLDDTRLTSSSSLLAITTATTGTTTLDVVDSDFDAAGSACIRTTGTGTSVLDASITGTDFTGCGTAAAANANRAAIYVDDQSSGAFTLDVDTSTFAASARGVIATTSAGGAKTLSITGSTFKTMEENVVAWTSTNCAARNGVTIQNTTIGTLDTSMIPVNNSGSSTGHGVELDVTGGASCIVAHAITGNHVYGVEAASHEGIGATYKVATGAQSVLRATGNVITLSTSTYNSSATAFRFANTGTAGTCYSIKTNDLTSAPSEEVHGTSTSVSQIENWTTSMFATLTVAANNNVLAVGNVNNPMSGFVAAPAGGCPNL